MEGGGSSTPFSQGRGEVSPGEGLLTVLTNLLADLLGGLLIIKILIIGLERHCILVHLSPLPISGLALLVSLIGTPHPIHGPPILSLQKYAKLTSVVMKTSTQTSLPWFYSFGNEYGCPLPRAWTVLTSLLADLLGGLLVDKILIIIGLETVYPHPSGPSQLMDLLSLRLLMAHLAQSMALQSSPYKDMQNKPWFYSFGNEYGCPLPRASTVLTSLVMLIFLVDCWSKKIIIIRLERHCILVHLHPLPTSGLALLASLNGTPRPIHGPPILALQRYAKLTSVVTRTNTQTNLDSTGLAMSMVVPFSEPERSWRAS